MSSQEVEGTNQHQSPLITPVDLQDITVDIVNKSLKEEDVSSPKNLCKESVQSPLIDQPSIQNLMFEKEQANTSPSKIEHTEKADETTESHEDLQSTVSNQENASEETISEQQMPDEEKLASVSEGSQEEDSQVSDISENSNMEEPDQTSQELAVDHTADSSQIESEDQQPIEQFKDNNITLSNQEEIQQSESLNLSTQSDQNVQNLPEISPQLVSEGFQNEVDEFFESVESEAALKAMIKKKQLLLGKENECQNNQNQSDETPKDAHKTQDRLNEEDQQTFSSVSPQKRKRAQTEIDKPSEQEAEFEYGSGISPGKQDVAAVDANDDLSSQNETSQQEGETDRAENDKPRLSKEPNQQRAPFQDLMNNHKRKPSEQNQKEAGQKDPLKKQSRIVDVNKVIFVDSMILNYSTFFPGKLLGSTLNVGNLTNSEQIVELSIDSNSFQFNKKTISEKFGNPELPYSLELDQVETGKKPESIVNSEVKHESWYIENPISKELTKRITLKLGPKAEQDFIIVVRSPNSKKSENLMSIINIGLLTYADEQFGVKESFEDFLKAYYNNSMKEFLRDRKKVAQSQRVEILLAGRIEVPSLICQKELLIPEFNEKVIPLVVKKGQSNQKFRIPFKNTGQQDLEIDFSFVKTSSIVQTPQLKKQLSGASEESKNIPQSPVEFSAVPSNLKVLANGTTILNIGAKLKNSYQLMTLNKQDSSEQVQKKTSTAKTEKFNHLLIAKIKDTSIMFSFIIEASVLESSGNTTTVS